MAEQMVKGMDWNKYGVLVENLDQNIKPLIISTKEELNKLDNQWFVVQKIDKGRKFFIDTQIDTEYGLVSYTLIYTDELDIQTI